MFCLILVILFCSSARAQQALPDSVRTEDTIVAGSESSAVDTVATDSSEGQKATDSVVFRNIPDSVLQRYKKDKDFAYADDPAYWVKEPVKHEKNFWDYLFEWINSRWFRGVIYALLGGILVFALYKIVVENKLYLFYTAPKKTAQEESRPADADTIDPEAGIKEAIAMGDRRLAIRYMYLKALRRLQEKGLIELSAQATDRQYVEAMQDHALGRNFRFLTNAYEYVWYGGFNLSQEQFASLQEQFEHFYEGLIS